MGGEARTKKESMMGKNHELTERTKWESALIMNEWGRFELST